jgi:predicted dinucleotide-binding enzyme
VRIAVLGTGGVGRAVAGRLAELGHEVTVGTRDPEETAGRDEYAAWAGEHGDVRLAKFADAAAEAELVVNASGGGVSLGVLEQAWTARSCWTSRTRSTTRTASRRGCS